MENANSNACCFFGHRTIDETPALTARLKNAVEALIVERGIDTFFFGSKSAFDRLCLSVVTEWKKKYPQIRRIYVRAEFPDITDSYQKYLLARYEETYYPDKLRGAGKAAYVERNYEMIDKSRYCICYCDTENNFTALQNSEKQKSAPHAKSGSVIALNYALKRKREIINLFK